MTTDLTASPAEVTGQLPSVTLTAAAIAKARELIEREGDDNLVLRIAVQPGGCAGLRYELFFDDRIIDGDDVTDFDGVRLAIDRMSKPYVAGSSIDYLDTLQKQGFSVDNPSAVGGCSCGDSFH